MTERYKNFMKNEPVFMASVYPNLTEKEKLDLWFSHWTFDFRDHPYHDPLDKFNPQNYRKWKIIERNIDKFLDLVFEDIECWSPWYEGCGWDDCKEEINRRLERNS